MAAIPPPSYTPPPADEPQRGVRDTFSGLVDDFVTWISTAPAELAALAANCYANAVEAFNRATAASTSAGNAATSEANALASANAAAVTAGVTLWISGQTVAQDAAKISPLDRRTYRRKTATGSGTTDPALDPTNYVLLSAGLAYTVLRVRDEKASGTNGGSSIAGTQTRALNTVKTNTIAGASVGSNQITLPAGSYEFSGSAPAQNVNGHQAYLYCVTDSATALLGTNEYASPSNGVPNRSVIAGEFTIASSKVYEVRHYTAAVQAGSGLGFNINSGNSEIYTEISFKKLS